MRFYNNIQQVHSNVREIYNSIQQVHSSVREIYNNIQQVHSSVRQIGKPKIIIWRPSNALGPNLW